jgi:hypothetical protein
VWRRRKTDDEQPALKKTANEIARDGFERFTGWAHQIFELDDARNERLATPRSNRGYGVAAAIAIKIANVRASARGPAPALAAQRDAYGFGACELEKLGAIGGTCRNEAKGQRIGIR